MQRYAGTPGISAPPAADGAEFIAQHQQPGRPLLVMAVHPLCSCTEASLAELGDLLARSAGRCDALVLDYAPVAAPADWPGRPRVLTLSGVRVPVIPDANGEQSALLGALTSGHVVFVDAGGAVRFRGGLTIARGHRGRAPGHDAILAALDGKTPLVGTSPVYGCGLENACAAEICR